MTMVKSLIFCYFDFNWISFYSIYSFHYKIYSSFRLIWFYSSYFYTANWLYNYLVLLLLLSCKLVSILCYFKFFSFDSISFNFYLRSLFYIARPWFFSINSNIVFYLAYVWALYSACLLSYFFYIFWAFSTNYLYFFCASLKSFSFP